VICTIFCFLKQITCYQRHQSCTA